jgi:hypothetical protein
MIDVPDAVSCYLQVAAEGDLEALLACFTSDAEVIDEGQTYGGHDEIRGWREAVTSKYSYTVTVLSGNPVDVDRYLVIVQLDGNFPGSTVQLRFRFGLRGGLISALEIAR